LPQEIIAEELDNCLNFIIERQRNLLLETGKPFDVVDAILSAQGHNPSRAAQAVDDLSTWVSRTDWHQILPTYSRCVRITRDLTEIYPVDEQLFDQEAETGLYQALVSAEAQERQPGAVNDFLNVFKPLMPLINEFFDQVLVMVDDDRVRQNRLGLLQRISALADGVVDMSKLEGF
jgi:glycyl-tRNA synthetase beta subunit